MNIELKKIDSLTYGLFIILCIFGGFYNGYIVLLGLIAGVIYIARHRNYNDVLCLLILLFPFAEIFKIPIVSTSMFTVLEIVFVFLWFYYEKEISKSCFIAIFLFLMYCMCTSTISGNISLLNILKIFMNIMLIYIFIDTYKPEFFHKFVFHFEFGLLVSSIMGLFKTSIPGFAAMYSDLNISWINGSSVTRFSATFSDPNYYTIAVVVALGLAIALNADSGINKDTTILGIALLVFGCTTYSKSLYLMIAILGIIALSILLYQGKIGWLLFAVFSIIVLIFSGALSNSEIIQTMLSRFNGISTDDMSSLTTGRWDIWEDYMSYILSDIRITLLGDGIGAPYYLGKAMHNIYVEMWYYVGLIGMVGYILVITVILSDRKFSYHRNIFNYFMIIIVAILYFFLAGFTSFAFPYYLMMCWVVLNANFSNKFVDYQFVEYDMEL